MNFNNTTADYARDMLGYGNTPPKVVWPQNALVALSFVLNYEEGGENSVLHGDTGSEQFLSEMFTPPAYAARHQSMETLYEYGSRTGVWRILNEFKARQLPLTIFAVGMALKHNPTVAQAFKTLGHEIAAHGWRWINYQNVDAATERAHIETCLKYMHHIYGQYPVGWYTGRDSPQTRQLVQEVYAQLGATLLYDSDSYADDLPYWIAPNEQFKNAHLIVPYTMDTNDMRFSLPQGFSTGEQFLSYLKDAFDVLYAEGEHTPKMMSIGLHCRLVGRPGRFKALQQFLDYVHQHQNVWITTRQNIAQHWIQNHPFTP